MDDARQTLDRLLVAIYDRARQSGYQDRPSLDALVAGLEAPRALVEKAARYLEAKGLLEWENQVADLTMEGILKAEALKRGESGRSLE